MAGPIEPLERLFEVDALPGAALPAELARLYGGDLGLADECLYANFVATLDGFVSIPGLRGSNTFIAGDNDADRFLMGVLRAYTDVVLIGAGVLRASPRGTWRPDAIYPPLAEEYAALRAGLGLTAAPEVAVLTGSGSIDPGHPLLASGALVLTSTSGAARLEGTVPEATTVVALADDRDDRPRPRRRGAPHARPPQDPQRGGAAHVRGLPRGGARRRALPHVVAAPDRGRRAGVSLFAGRGSRSDARRRPSRASEPPPPRLASLLAVRPRSARPSSPAARPALGRSRAARPAPGS